MASNGETVDTTVQTGGSFMRVFTRCMSADDLH